MCGITGIIQTERSRPIDEAILRRMTKRLQHRGPDDDGFFVAAGGGLAMQRLAIINPTEGRQPVFNETGDIAVVCNGEIYNFCDLRTTLRARGHTIRPGSDAEVIAHAYEEWGAAFVEHLEGMFAVALWDRRTHEIYLARDRLGKKPLYYFSTNETLYFASELKALREIAAVPRSVDPRALQRYLLFGYIPAPDTILQGVHKLEAGSLAQWKNGTLTCAPYWTPPPRAIGRTSRRDAIAAFHELLQNSVRKRLQSDVPLGVLLSGGLDSTSILALAQQLEPDRTLQTFSIGFTESRYDESSAAADVAKYYGAQHHEQIVGGRDIVALLPRWADIMDEPFGDDSLLPSFLLSALARDHVTVALSGDGADELFWGYPTYLAERLHRMYRRVPSLVRRAGEYALLKALPTRSSHLTPDYLVRKFVQGTHDTIPMRHARWVGTSLTEPELAALTGVQVAAPFADLQDVHAATGTWDDAVDHYYLRYYLPDDILTKMDRASMASSLEVRAPYCEPELLALARALPTAWKWRGLSGKWFQKRALRPLLPPSVVKKKKQGFALPTAEWLRTDLRGLLTDYLSPAAIARHHLLDPKIVERYVREHLDGTANHRQIVWSLLMFTVWQESLAS